MTDWKYCEFCGKRFYPNPSSKKFCRKQCRQSWHWYFNDYETNLKREHQRYLRRKAAQ